MNEQLRKLADAIAVSLGEGWSGSDGRSSGHAYLDGPDGVRLQLRTGTYQIGNDRLAISGDMPADWHDHAPSRYGEGPQDPGTITVAISKAPARIAGDITRRLLPGWRTYLAATAENKARSEARDQATQEFGDAFIAALGGRGRWLDDNRHSSRRRQLTEIDAGRYGDAIQCRIRIGDEVAIERLQMSRDDALAFAAWMATRQERAVKS